MLNRFNARTRIMLVVLFSVLPVMALVIYSGLQQRSAAEAAERGNLLLIAELTAKRPSQVIEGARQLLFAMAGNVDELRADRNACHAYFKPLVSASAGLYHSAGLILPDGELFCSSAAAELGVRIDLTDRLHFSLAADGQPDLAAEKLEVAVLDRTQSSGRRFRRLGRDEFRQYLAS